MLTVDCPSCGAPVVFRSPALPVVVCGYCQAMVTRIGDELRAMGKAAVLPFDISPIRIGTTGRVDGQGFAVIGRVRWGYDAGSWNEWLLLFDDAGHAWLGEAAGQYMLLRELPAEQVGDGGFLGRVLRGAGVVTSTPLDIAGRTLKVYDVREAMCLAAEGELPFATPPGWIIRSIDLRDADGNCASIQRGTGKDAGRADVYVGRYVTLADLAPAGLRAIEGWAMPAFAAP